MNHYSQHCLNVSLHYNTNHYWYNFDHSHKKRKDSLEARVVFRWILTLTWNFGGGRSDSASTFFKISSASCFWCYQNYNWLFYILDDDNVISTRLSGVVQRIPTDEKDNRKCSFICFALYSNSIQRADQHIVNIKIVVFLIGCT